MIEFYLNHKRSKWLNLSRQRIQKWNTMKVIKQNLKLTLYSSQLMKFNSRLLSSNPVTNNGNYSSKVKSGSVNIHWQFARNLLIDQNRNDYSARWICSVSINFDFIWFHNERDVSHFPRLHQHPSQHLVSAI